MALPGENERVAEGRRGEKKEIVRNKCFTKEI